MFEDSFLSTGAKGQHSQEMNKIEAPSLTFKWLLASFDVFHLLKIFYWEPQILVQQKYPAVDGRWALLRLPMETAHGFSSFSHSLLCYLSRWLTWRDTGKGFPFFLAICLMIFMALAFLFWEISHRGDSGTHLGYRKSIISTFKQRGTSYLAPHPFSGHKPVSGRDLT